MTAGDARKWKEFHRGRWGSRGRADIEAYHGRLEFPERTPFFQDLHVDGRGNAWVRRYESLASEADYVWDVVGPDGVRVAEVTAPYALFGARPRVRLLSRNLMQVGDSTVLIWGTDDWGVQRIGVHTVIKDAEGA